MTVNSATAAPAFVAEIAARVDARVGSLLDADRERWTSVDADLAEPLAALHELLLAGGKRLRPVFCHWAFVGAGGDPDDQRVVDAGAALELLHTMAVIHDDVMDGSVRRHGIDALHHRFALRHGQAGWRGEGRRFAEGVAILIGDLAYVYSDILFGDAPPAAWQLFNQLRLEVNIGQYLDMLATARADATPALARRICRYKSGKYTVERPMHLGAALSAPDRVAELSGPLTNYGLPLGEAFQLKDDLLGVFGDPAVTGKAVGEDLREGKPTLLYALARQRASGGGARLLAERFGAPDLSTEEVGAIQAVFEETGARSDVEATIEELVDESLTAASDLPLIDEARQALIELARFVAGRNH